MLMVSKRNVMWLLVIWFAVLQTVSPFIHGHLGGDSPAQGHGLHIHAYEELSDTQHNLKSGGLVHTIGVDEALVEDINLLPPPLFTLLFALILSALTAIFFHCAFALHFRLPLFLRTLSRPRAPPFL